MLLFCLIAIATSLALGFILWPLIRQRVPAQNLNKQDIAKENLRIYQAQHAELVEELEAGRLSQADFVISEQELAERLAQEELAAAADTTTDNAAPIKPVHLIIITSLFIIVTAGIYYAASDSSGMNAFDMSADTAPPPPAKNLPEDHPNITGSDIEKMVAGLAERLKTEPDNQEGWVMLGRSYLVLGRYTEAAEAYERANRLSLEDDAELLTNFAEALLFTQDSKFTGETRALLNRALRANPTHPKALWYAGIGAFEKGEYAQAVRHWEALKKHAPPEVVNKVLDDNIARARALANPQAAAPATQPTEQPTDNMDNSALNIRITLAPELRDQVTPTQALFIFVKTTDGQPMPLAVTRHTAGDLPLTITLSDNNAMMPSHKLSDFSDYQVGARISQSGTATLAPGDLFGNATATRAQAATVQLTIDTIAQ